MAGFHNQLWVTYAGDETEAKKCMVLGRALKETLTTRSLGVILSTSGVTHDSGWLLQKEFQQCYWVNPGKYPKGLKFRSIAKLYAHGLSSPDKIVFLDNNCLPLKNCDDFFQRDGIQWIYNKNTRDEIAAIIVKPKILKNDARDSFMEAIVTRENPELTTPINETVQEVPHSMDLLELDYCVSLQLTEKHPKPLDGRDLKMVYFADGHPLDEMSNPQDPFLGILEQEIRAKYKKQCDQVLQPTLNRDPSYILPELHDSIAVIGMACIYPSANNLDEFWSLLEEGRDGMTKVPDWRWNKDQALTRMNCPRDVEAGFLPCPIDKFDAKFFNTNATEAQLMDPQQRLSLKVVWRALEHAGIDPITLKNTLTGVFGGWWRTDYTNMMPLNLNATSTSFLRTYMGNGLGPLTAKISHFLELIGPSFSTESGCSTSVAGMDMACQSLRSETSNLAIALGANLLLHPFSTHDNGMEGVLALDGRCKTFDESANGFGRSEGIGVVILKRFSNAVADGDRIWGIIRGSAVVQEGTSKSMGTPTVDVEAKAMQLALDRAGVDPDDVDFLETHGTGTPVGDPIEVAAIAKSYSCKSRGRTNVLTIGSVKTNIGHTESVCGITGLQKVLLSMHHGLIPKHLHLNKLNSEIDLSSIPARIPSEQALNWPNRKDGKPRIAGINSFGITGAQAHIVVQEPPTELPLPKLPIYDSRKKMLLTFSAKTEVALQAQINSYIKLLQESEHVNLTDMEFTMHLGRPHFQMRGVLVGETAQEILANLEFMTVEKIQTAPTSKLCFMFPGQGSQYPGMAKHLYCDNVVFQTHFDWCDSILSKDHGLLQLKEALWSEKHHQLLKSSLYSQVSIFCIQFCLLKLWESWGVIPDAVVGHSLGEFAACVAAGMVSPKDAIKLVVGRSKLINALPTSSMLVVAADAKKVSKLLSVAFSNTKLRLDVAAINSENQTVLAGITETAEKFKLICENNNVKAHILDSAHAYHSELMDPMLKEYEKIAASLTFTPASSRCRYISGADGREVNKVDASYWVRHTREMVRFLEASHTTLTAGFTTFLEIGAQPILSSFIMLNADETENPLNVVQSINRKYNDWEIMLSSLGKLYSIGYSINWENFHRYSKAKKVDLPGYHFEEASFWIEVRQDGSTPFHPLLGSYFPNALGCTIFQNKIDLDEVKFLKDHSFGDKVIFPCAGYLDMCLTAGYAATRCEEGTYKKPDNPVSIRDFSIVSPICLDEVNATDLQVAVTKTATGEVCCKIFTHLLLDDGSYKWVENAKASFNSFTANEPSSLINFQEIRARCSMEMEGRVSYKTIEQYGYNFGPSLQVVTKCWKNPKEYEFVFKFGTHETAEEMERFIIHPWVIDSMLQMLTVGLGIKLGVKKQLAVPVAMDNYTWWGRSSGSGYVYTNHTTELNEAHVLDEDGNLMASLYGVEFMDTTLPHILALIESQKHPYPALAEIMWKEKLGPMMRRIPEDKLASLKLLDEFVQKNSGMSEGREDMQRNIQAICGLFMLKSMKELKLDSRSRFTWPAISEELGVISEFSKLLHHILLELAEDGIIENMGESSFKVSKLFPTLASISAGIAALTITDVNKVLQHVTPIWDKLSSILTGKITVSSMQQPALSSTPPLELFLSEGTKLRALYHVHGNILRTLSTLGKKSIVRVLQVGSGIGNITAELISHIKDVGTSHFEYTFTEPSNEFQLGQKLFNDTGITSIFRILDVEEDPVSQGFIPAYYDLIIVSPMLKNTEDMKQTLNYFKRLTRPHGYTIMTAIAKADRQILLSLGLTAPFCRNWDENFCSTEMNNWSNALEHNQNGFTVVEDGSFAIITYKHQLSNKPFTHATNTVSDETNSNGTWILISPDNSFTHSLDDFVKKIKDARMTVQIISWENLCDATTGLELEQNVTNVLESVLGKQDNVIGMIFSCELDISPQQICEPTPQKICEPFLYICKYLASFKGSIKLLVFTQGNMCAGPTDFSQSCPSTSPIIGIANVLANENSDLQVKIVDLSFLGENSSNVTCEAFSELIMWDEESMVAYRDNYRCIPRLRPYKPKHTPLEIPHCDRYRLFLPKSHLISDLTFGKCEVQPVGADEVEIEVKAYGLNFLDVLMVTKPDEVFEDYNAVGIDVAGVISAVGVRCNRKIGERVSYSRRSGLGMPSHVVVPEDEIVPIPINMTMGEASTFPLATATIGECLKNQAKISKDDTVLIHTASGGVGLIAIQYAQFIGCKNIVVTAGNERKRNYLRNMGLKHVFNSRNTDYEKNVREALGGKGITVALNSLTGPGFKEATLALCDEGARFIEMSKMNIWSKEQVQQMRPDVYYEVVDVSQLTKSARLKLTDDLNRQLHRGGVSVLVPVPTIRFDCADIRDALEYIEKAKHIGKVIVTMPDMSGVAPKFDLFNPESTYLVTGGLGGIGLEVVQWMGNCGATNIIITGRTPPNSYADERINKMKASGIHIDFKKCDVGNWDELKEVFCKAECEDPPIRGIMHIAGVISDATFENQTWEKFETVFRSKIQGGWNLHELSTKLRYPLEHFVVFSSVSATLGPPGQSGYAGANTYLDSLVHYRNSVGLPATTINWGQWNGVGMAANLVHPVIRPFSINQGLSALRHAIQSHKTQIVPCDGDIGYLKSVLNSTRGLLADMEHTLADGKTEIDGTAFWAEYDGCADMGGKYEVVRKFVKRLIRLTLRMDKNEEINDHVKFEDMEMNSLSMVEMKNGLQASVGKRVKLSINSIKDCKTVAQLSERLVRLISGTEELTPISRKELIELIAMDAQLPKEIEVDGTAKAKLKPLSEITTALVTGSTGMFGSYILRELLKRPTINKVYCLIRRTHQLSCLERFKHVLEQKKLLNQIDMAKVEIIEGDITKTNFGMEPRHYDPLVKEVDAIFNIAANVAFGELYGKTNNPNSCRVSNVFGLQNILKFAIRDKLKYIFHPSTIAAETQVDINGQLLEDWPNIEQLGSYPNSAYVICKLICDCLIQQAVERGVPCKVFRIPYLGGDSDVVGGANVQTDSFLLVRLFTYMHMGIMPAINIPTSIIPVNQCAKMSVDLFFNDATGYEVYNLFNPHLGDEREFDSIAGEFGVFVDLLEPEDFFERVAQLDDKDEIFQFAKQIIAYEEDRRRLEEDGLPVINSFIAGNKKVFWSNKLERLIPEQYPNSFDTTWDIVRRDLLFAKNTGVFDRYRIKGSGMQEN